MQGCVSRNGQDFLRHEHKRTNKFMQIQNRSRLYAAATKMAGGITLHSVILNLVHVLLAPFQAALDAARNKESIYQASRDGKRSAVLAQTAARLAAEAYIVKARDALRPFLGTNWSEAWTQAGFKNGTLSLPSSMPEVVELLRSQVAYFAGHAAQENAAAGVTGAAGAALLATLSGAVQTVSNCKRDQRAKREDRDASEASLLKMMRQLHSELESVLEWEDVRWLDFEDENPTPSSVPEEVTGVQAEGDGPGRLTLEWFPSPRAEQYHVEIFEVGTDTDFRRVLSVVEPGADLENLTPGVQARVRIVATNAAGNAAPSDEVTLQVPALANAA